MLPPTYALDGDHCLYSRKLSSVSRRQDRKLLCVLVFHKADTVTFQEVCDGRTFYLFVQVSHIWCTSGCLLSPGKHSLRVFPYGFLFTTKSLVQLTIKSSSYRECDPSELIGLFQ